MPPLHDLGDIPDRYVIVFGDNAKHVGAGGFARMIREPGERTPARSVFRSRLGVRAYGIVVKREPTMRGEAFMPRIPQLEINALVRTVSSLNADFVITPVGTGLARMSIHVVAEQLSPLISYQNVVWDDRFMPFWEERMGRVEAVRDRICCDCDPFW